MVTATFSLGSRAIGLRAIGAGLGYLRVDMLTAALITLMCLGENNARNSPLHTSLVFDMDKQTVAGDGIGCHNDQPCPITEVTEGYIRFKISDAWSGK